MGWIKVIPYEEADVRLKKVYDRIKGANGAIDNVLSIHSLRPHTLVGHMTLYKNVLHNSDNELPKWYLESIGVYVSSLNKCEYCVAHHFAGLKRLLNDNMHAGKFEEALTTGVFDSIFEGRYQVGMKYARKLTLNHHIVEEEDIQLLRVSGFSDGEILEINQTVSYFNYVNRTVMGLGVNLKGDVLGLSPNNSSDSTDWKHK